MREHRVSSIKRNIFISLSVQVISLGVSFILSLIVPRYIPEIQYARWQNYLLYTSYVGVLHFGLLDGFVLRYSQYDYNQLDKDRVRSQFYLLLVLTGTLSLIGLAISLQLTDVVSSTTFILVSVSILTKNIFTYSSYSFQVTNRINKYAQLVLLQRITYGGIVLLLVVLGVDGFFWYCIADLLGDLAGIMVGLICNKDICFGRGIKLKEALAEAKSNVSAGCILLLANWSATLLVGSAKMIIQWKWGELTFGKVSFAFSLSNLALVFIGAISVVLFPSLKRMDQGQLPGLYMKIRNVLSPLLYMAMLCYFPGTWMLNRFLPAYQESLVCLATLLPIIIYTSQISLLTNNYLKAYRKEKYMLLANVVSFAIAVVAFFVAAVYLNSLVGVLMCIVLATMIKSMLSELIVMRTIKISFKREFLVEGLMTGAFILIANSFTWITGGLLYFLVLVIYFLSKKNTIVAFFD